MRWLCGRSTPKWLASWQARGPFFHHHAAAKCPKASKDACWRDPKRSPELGRRSLALFFLAIYKKKKLYSGSRVWVWLRFGAGDRSAQGISAVTCHGIPTRVQTARALRSAPAPALLRCAHSAVQISKPAHPTAADPCRHRCRASNNARPDPALRCSPRRIAAFSLPLSLSPSHSATQLRFPPTRGRHSHFGILCRDAQLIPATARPRRNPWIGVFGWGVEFDDAARSARCTAAEHSAGPRPPSRVPFGEPACGFACVASSTLPARAPRCAPACRACIVNPPPWFLAPGSPPPVSLPCRKAPTMPRHLAKNACNFPRRIFPFCPLFDPCSNSSHSRRPATRIRFTLPFVRHNRVFRLCLGPPFLA